MGNESRKKLGEEGMNRVSWHRVVNGGEWIFSARFTVEHVEHVDFLENLTNCCMDGPALLL